MPKKSDVEKYSRREFFTKIGYGTKVLASGILYGAIGNVAGRVYQGGKDRLNKIDEAITKPYQKVEDTFSKSYEKVSDFFDNLTGKEKQKKPEKPKKKEEKKISRRGFLNYFLHLAHEHPELSGTIIGGTYGIGKSAVKNYEKYQNKLDRLILKLETAKNTKTIKELKDQIEYLELEIKSLDVPRKTKSLDDKIEAETLLIVGISILIFSIILNSFETTGYAVLRYKIGFITLDAVLFFISLILIFLGIRGR